MMPFLSLLGFAPDPTVQVGEDVLRATFSPEVQQRWAERSGRLRSAFPGWVVRWNEVDGSPLVLAGPGVSWERGGELLAEIARLAGIEPGSLVFESTRARGPWVGVRYRQTFRGAPVEWGSVDLVARDGRVVYVRSSLPHVELVGELLPGGWILPRPDRTARSVLRSDDGTDVVYRDGRGEVVHRWTRRLPLEETFAERDPSGPLVAAPMRSVLVSDGVTQALTDSVDGSTTLTGPLTVGFDGPTFTVLRSGLVERAIGVDDGVVDLGVDVDASTTSAHAFAWRVYDWLALRDPTHPFLGVHVDLTVDDSGSCNAFYLDDAITFLDAGGGCPATALLADVVYHEYGHGVHDNGLVAGIFAADVSEGSADYVSATINDDPNVGVGFFGAGSVLRELDTNHRYPEDVGGDPHYSGLIWGGFFWDVRTELVADLGYEAGTAAADQLFLGALALGPQLWEFEAILTADDDDGDPSDGTPNDCLLYTQGSLHGLATDPFDLLAVESLEAPDLPTALPSDPPRTISFRMTPSSRCAELDPSSVRVHYAVQPAVDAALADIAFTEVVPTVDGTGKHTAAVPVQPSGTKVVFYVSWASLDGTRSNTSHHGDVDALFQYWTGDQADLWCDDFESGGPGWTFGGGEFAIGQPAPGRAYGATEAASGLAVLGQNLDGGGGYASDTESRALSPEIDLSASHRTMLLLDFQRWLTIDAYDLASVRASVGGVVWQSGTVAPTLDPGWVEQELDLEPVLAEGAATVQVAFTLAADSVVAYDGWTVDDVCLRSLADVPGHYRRVGLAATDDRSDRVEVSWANPFVQPLAATTLVRKLGSPPIGVDDGEVLATAAAPTPGAPASYTDAAVAPGEVWYYALFAADAEGAWFDAVAGENLDPGGAPSATEEPPGTTDSMPDDGDGPTDPSCGCAAGPRSAGWLVIALLVVGRRRR